MSQKIMVDRLRRLELSHMFRGIRTRNNPDKFNYHATMVIDCRTKIDYILKKQEHTNENTVHNVL